MSKVGLCSFILAFTLFFLSACEKDDDAVGTDDAPSGTVTVAGEVISKEDLGPADGGVTINLRQDNDEQILLFFRFYLEEPSESRKQLYETIKLIKAGDRVEASGLRKGYGIEIGQIARL